MTKLGRLSPRNCRQNWSTGRPKPKNWLPTRHPQRRRTCRTRSSDGSAKRRKQSACSHRCALITCSTYTNGALCVEHVAINAPPRPFTRPANREAYAHIIWPARRALLADAASLGSSPAEAKVKELARKVRPRPVSHALNAQLSLVAPEHQLWVDTVSCSAHHSCCKSMGACVPAAQIAAPTHARSSP